MRSSFVTLTSTSNHRAKRSVVQNERVSARFLEYLDPGTWYLALYNDGANDEVVEIETSKSGVISELDW